MRILLAGHAGCYNRGCEAILKSTIAMLNKEFNKPDIIISSFDHKGDKKINFDAKVKIIPSHLRKVWKPWSWQWILRQIYKIYSKQDAWKLEFFPLILEIKKADVVISIGGDNYSTDYGLVLDYFLKLNILAKKYNKKLIIWGASIGPFLENDKLGEIIDNLKLPDLITVRESNTADYLLKLGIVNNVKQVADPAFLLLPEAVDGGKIFLGAKDKNILGLNVSPILSNYNRNEKDIMKELSNFLRMVIESSDFHILLIPHVMQIGGINNDYTFMQNFYEKFKKTNRISAVAPIYNAMQIKYIISKCRFFIGARTHTTIASLSMSIPTLSIGYSLKAKGINKDIFGNYDFLLDIKELSAEGLMKKFVDLQNRESEIKTILLNAIPKIKEKSLLNIKYLKNI